MFVETSPRCLRTSWEASLQNVSDTFASNWDPVTVLVASVPHHCDVSPKQADGSWRQFGLGGATTALVNQSIH